MSKARELASLGNAYSDGSLSNRNLIINGAMQVWERGTSFTSAYASRLYTADRWQVYNVQSGSTATVTQSTDVPLGEGFLYSAKFDPSGQTGNTTFTTSVELPLAGNAHPFVAGRRYTFSAWVKTSDTVRSTLYTARFATSVASGVQNCTITEVVGHTGGGDWERVVYYIDVPETLSLGSANQLRLMLGNKDGALGNTSIAYYTGVQLEVGDTATPFEHRSYGQELALCQRYYVKHTEGYNSPIGAALYESSNVLVAVCNFPVEMRSTPTLVAPSGANYYFTYPFSDTFNSLSIAVPTTKRSLVFNSSEVVGSTGNATTMRINNASAYVAFDAEL